MIYSQNYPLYCKHIIRHILAPILRDLLDWGEGVAGISKLTAMPTSSIFQFEKLKVGPVN
jgi:hypothetical protein